MLTVMRIMALALWRDRGALLLAFGLPPLMFFVFAEVFSGAGDEDFTLRVAILDEHGSARSALMVETVSALDGIAIVEGAVRDSDDLEARVRAGDADAALWLRGDPALIDPEKAPVVIVGDGSRALAAAVLAGRVQRVLAESFPAVAIERALVTVESLAGPLGDAQRARMDAALATLRQRDGQARTDGDDASWLEQRLLGAGRGNDPGVSYYAGAVAILFLLFSAFQGAISLIDERSSGIHDRLMAGPGGIGVVVVGKGLFLTAQGLIQAALIFALASTLYGLDWWAQFGAWLVTALLAATIAAWGGLLLASVCTSRAQAQTASAFVVLLLSAVGGSMMPRFLMPGWLRELGWLTPNAWVIESWQDQFWRGLPVADLAPAWGVLFAAAAGLVIATMLIARHRMLSP
ncbi:MAG: ABC transporter permease [Wenzhouxiangellaceae bacterium]|nr:ABC transporter permease [Wenzhouxiangellaceae bacterium]